MKRTIETCDICRKEDQVTPTPYGLWDLCLECKLDVDRLMLVKRRIHIH